MKILFTGGGTMGPVTPLLAVWEAWRAVDADVEAIWVGTARGPERDVVESQDIPFLTIPTVRFPRYISIEWLTLPFKFCWAMYKSFCILRFQKPDLVASAGGFTAVPVIFAAKLLGMKVWVHQQDVEIILTNKLTVPFANVVTVAWERNKKELGKKARLIGNPVRPSRLKGSVKKAQKTFKLNKTKPTVLVFGGGNGAAWINHAIHQISNKLAKHANIIHVTGLGKSVESTHSDYHVREFLDEDMADALAVADIVVCRAGLSTITELAALAKASVIIPLPHSPQESNAKMVEDASVVLDQNHTSELELLNVIETLLGDDTRRKELGEKIHTKLRTHIADELVEMLRSA